MTGPTIRPAKPGDIPSITGIYADAVLRGTASFELEPPSESEMAERQARILSVGLPYLVAEIAGEVCGYAYAGRYHTRAGYRFTVEDSIYVAPSAHRKGAGRALLSELIAITEAKGFRQMIAVIGDSRQEGSIRLHAALGFRPAGTLKSVGFKHGRWLDSVLMQRALGGGNSSAP